MISVLPEVLAEIFILIFIKIYQINGPVEQQQALQIRWWGITELGPKGISLIEC